MKAITRSVVLGAAMIPAAVLAGCRHDATPTTGGTGSSGGSGGADAGTGSDGAASTQAPPPDVVRPRSTDQEPQMPTRGFAGAVRARR